jgi:hypothetical protein
MSTFNGAKVMKRSPSWLWEEMDRLFTFFYLLEFNILGFGSTRPNGFGANHLERLGFRPSRPGLTVKDLLNHAYKAGILDVFLSRKPVDKKALVYEIERQYTFMPSALRTLRLQMSAADEILGFSSFSYIAQLYTNWSRFSPALEAIRDSDRPTLCFDWKDFKFEHGGRYGLEAEDARVLMESLTALGAVSPIYLVNGSGKIQYQVLDERFRQVFCLVGYSTKAICLPELRGNHIDMAVVADVLYQARYGAHYLGDENGSVRGAVSASATKYRQILAWLKESREFFLAIPELTVRDGEAPTDNPLLLYWVLRELAELSVVLFDEEGEDALRVLVDTRLLDLLLAAANDHRKADEAIRQIDWAADKFDSKKIKRLRLLPKPVSDKYDPDREQDLWKVYLLSRGSNPNCGSVREAFGRASRQHFLEVIAYGRSRRYLVRSAATPNIFVWKNVPPEQRTGLARLLGCQKREEVQLEKLPEPQTKTAGFDIQAGVVNQREVGGEIFSTEEYADAARELSQAFGEFLAVCDNARTGGETFDSKDHAEGAMWLVRAVVSLLEESDRARINKTARTLAGGRVR